MQNKTSVRFKLFLLAFALYLFIANKNITQAAVIQISDCSSPLNSAGDTYQLQGNITGNCLIEADNIIVDGQGLYTITGNVSGNGTTTGVAGFDFEVKDLTVTGTTSANGIGFSSHNNHSGVTGGNIIIRNSTVGVVTTLGGEGIISDDGGNAGNITVIDSETDDLFADGGIGYSRSPGAGNGGTITITNSTVGDVYSRGGYGDYAGHGGAISITDSTTGALVSADGGDAGAGNAEGGNGGNITIDSSTIYAISSTGGDGGGFSSGYGGTISITDSTFTTIDVDGGSPVSWGPAGAGGDVTLIRSSGTSISSSGGYDSGYGANGGDIVITDSTITTIENYGNDDGDDGSLTITDNDPTLTLLGDNPLELAFGSIWADEDPGATATDAKDGTLTDDIVVSNEPNTSIAGDYEVTYEVSDSGTSLTWNGSATSTSANTVSDTRTVTVLAAPADDTPPPSGRRSSKSNSSNTVQNLTQEQREELIQTLKLKLVDLIKQLIVALQQQMNQ